MAMSDLQPLQMRVSSDTNSRSLWNGDVMLDRGGEPNKFNRTLVRHLRVALAGSALFATPAQPALAANQGTFTMEQVLAYPFVPELDAAEKGDAIAFVRVVKGVRNVWVADGPAFKPRQVTQYTADDGQEITQLTFSPDGKHLVYVRGGDHDANWEAKLPPDPSFLPDRAKGHDLGCATFGRCAGQGGRGRRAAISSSRRTCLRQGQAGVDGAADGQGQAEAPVLRPRQTTGILHGRRTGKARLCLEPRRRSQLHRSLRPQDPGADLSGAVDRPRRFSALVARRHAHRFCAASREGRCAEAAAEADAQSLVDLGRRCREPEAQRGSGRVRTRSSAPSPKPRER